MYALKSIETRSGTVLKLPKEIYEEIIDRALDAYPWEACGILGGTGLLISEFIPTNNVDRSSEHFMMDPLEQFAAVRALREKGLGITAIYHSHPFTPARPSEEDIRLALTPGVSHVIVSLRDLDRPAIKSFRIEDGAVREEELLVI